MRAIVMIACVAVAMAAPKKWSGGRMCCEIWRWTLGCMYGYKFHNVIQNWIMRYRPRERVTVCFASYHLESILLFHTDSTWLMFPYSKDWITDAGPILLHDCPNTCEIQSSAIDPQQVTADRIQYAYVFGCLAPKVKVFSMSLQTLMRYNYLQLHTSVVTDWPLYVCNYHSSGQRDSCRKTPNARCF